MASPKLVTVIQPHQSSGSTMSVCFVHIHNWIVSAWQRLSCWVRTHQLVTLLPIHTHWDGSGDEPSRWNPDLTNTQVPCSDSSEGSVICSTFQTATVCHTLKQGVGPDVTIGNSPSITSLAGSGLQMLTWRVLRCSTGYKSR